MVASRRPAAAREDTPRQRGVANRSARRSTRDVAALARDQPRPRRGPPARVHAHRRQRGLAQRIRQIGGSIMQRRGGVMDRGGVQKRSCDARHGRRLRQLPQPSNTTNPIRRLPLPAAIRIHGSKTLPGSGTQAVQHPRSSPAALNAARIPVTLSVWKEAHRLSPLRARRVAPARSHPAVCTRLLLFA